MEDGEGSVMDCSVVTGLGEWGLSGRYGCVIILVIDNIAYVYVLRLGVLIIPS